MEKMMKRVKEMHEKRCFKENGGEDILFRMNLIMEEVGEICSSITKAKGDLAEEHADLLILLLGNCVSLNIDIVKRFNDKMDKIENCITINECGNSRIVSSAQVREDV